MDQPDRTGGAATLRLDDNRVKEQIKRIQEYVWARHVDGSDDYDHSIDETEAIQTLDAFYTGIGNRNSPDQVYLGILLFESAFELPDEEQEATFARAKRIFDFYKKVTGEDDWPAVEDRLEDIDAYFVDKRGDEPVAVDEAGAEADTGSDAAAEVGADSGPDTGEATPATEAAEAAEAATQVAEEPAEPVVEAPPAPVVEVARATETSVVEDEPHDDGDDEQPEGVSVGPMVEAPKAPKASKKSKPVEEPVAAPVDEPAGDAVEALDSAAEEEERRVAEEHAARREATEAFVADLEVVDGMQLVPAGTFLYGPEPREIFLDSFYVDKVPVTNAEYQRFVLETGYRTPRFENDPRFKDPQQPVVGVSLGDARQFARWAGKELPSEQQWEKAARGTDGRVYPWGNDPPGTSDASFGQDPTEGGPAKVGASLRNVSPFGACDMAGGAWEWTSSRFEHESDFQCVRGGSYNDPAEMLEVSYRLEVHPKDKSEAIGFRCVRNIHH